jgi:phage tail-like protein
MPLGLPSLPNDAIASYHFSVEIDNTEIAQFSELSGITSEIDVIELKENMKENGRFIIKKLPGFRKPPTITLKRAKNASMDLWNWHYAMYQGNIGEARRNGSVVLYDYSFGEVARYNFVNGWVSKITMGAAKAGANEVLTEECTIVCEDLIRVK